MWYSTISKCYCSFIQSPDVYCGVGFLGFGQWTWTEFFQNQNFLNIFLLLKVQWKDRKNLVSGNQSKTDTVLHLPTVQFVFLQRILDSRYAPIIFFLLGPWLYNTEDSISTKYISGPKYLPRKIIESIKITKINFSFCKTKQNSIPSGSKNELYWLRNTLTTIGILETPSQLRKP